MENSNTEQSQIPVDPASRIKDSTEISSNQAEELERLRSEQNLPMGILGGFAAAVIGAILWALMTVLTGYQIGYAAIGLGFIVGFSVQYLGKGVDPIFGISGAVLALFGCVLGNFLGIIGGATEDGATYMDTFNLVLEIGIFNVMSDAFGFMDLLFYGIAAYEGFKFSFRTMV